MLDENFKIDLPEKDIAKEAPIFVRGQVEKAVKSVEDRINTADFNKNGVPDIAEAAVIVNHVLPALLALNEAIDFEKAAEMLAAAPCIKDKAMFAAALIKLGQAAESVGKLAPSK